MLPTDRLGRPSNVTYHHSRLMGVSDIQNAVSTALAHCPCAYSFIFWSRDKLVLLSGQPWEPKKGEERDFVMKCRHFGCKLNCYLVSAF